VRERPDAVGRIWIDGKVGVAGDRNHVAIQSLTEVRALHLEHVCVRRSLEGTRRHAPAQDAQERALVKRFMTAWDAVDVDGLVALLTEDALMTMPPERMRVAGAGAIGDFFASVPQGGRLDEIRLVETSANRQPALAAYSRGDDRKHRPSGLMVLQIENDLITAIVGFPDPWLFAQRRLPSDL
jgi:hypothetical protein